MISSKRMPRHKQKHMKNRAKRHSGSMKAGELNLSTSSHSSSGGIHPLIILISVVIIYVILTSQKGIAMSNVIKADFGSDAGKAGYLMDNKGGDVDGVYNGDIAAMKLEDGNVVIGTKSVDGIEQATFASMKDMNQFCLMWLLIFDPSVIAEE